jgi:hypothetical protein
MKVKSWDGNLINDGSNYTAVMPGVPGFPEARYASSKRPRSMPILGQMSYRDQVLPLAIAIEGSDTDTLLVQLKQWFDPKDDTSKQLIVTDDDGSSNERYIMARPKSMIMVRGSARRIWAINLAVDGEEDPDGRFRETSLDSDNWNASSSGDTNSVSNPGQDDAYPVYKLKPTNGKSSDFGYSRWVPVRWNVLAPATNYPIDLGNAALSTSGLIGGGKLQSDGDDFRVRVDGQEVDFWFGNFNATTSRVWVNLDFVARKENLLVTAIASSGSIDSIEIRPYGARNTFLTPVSEFPSSGTLVIDSEAFAYTGIDVESNTFTGITRAVNGTSQASHTVDDEVWLVQHDIWMVYGSGSAPAYDVDDTNKPLFDLDTSTNARWNFADFNSASLHRSAQWHGGGTLGFITEYGTTQRGAVAEPYSVIGVSMTYQTKLIFKWTTLAGLIHFYNPCGISRVNITSANKYLKDLSVSWSAFTRAGSGAGGEWVDEWEIVAPTVANTWQSWTRDETLASMVFQYGIVRQPTHFGVGLEVSHSTLTDAAIEVNTADVYLDTNYIPSASPASEQSGPYLLDGVLENTTTGESMSVFCLMQINETLEIDTDAKTVKYLKDGSNQFQAVTIEPLRLDWLRLQAGSNTLKFTESGLSGMNIVTEWRNRYYYG